MASPAFAINGATPNSVSRPGSPMSTASSTKRKRDDTDDGVPHETSPTGPTSASNDDGSSSNAKPPVDMVLNGARSTKPRDATVIRDYFRLLQRYDADTGVLKRLVPSENSTGSAPQAKRQKSEDETSSGSSSIEEKVATGSYDSLETLMIDIANAARAQLTSLKSPGAEQDGPIEKVDDLCAKVNNLKEKALELYRRELSYPNTEHVQSIKSEGEEASQVSGGRASLLTYANIGGLKNRPLLTSLQLPVGSPVDGGEPRPGPGNDIIETKLPAGIVLAHSLAESQPCEKLGRTLSLGELFPSPRNLPPLQPPKPTKSTTKSNVLTFYHPMLTMQSRYRTGTYFSQQLTMGQWLDYSNATPAAHIKTKQRERAQSLAGVKPSTTELEMSEMETLFRRAFSSFAPCKDDTAAMVPSGQLSRMYWQRYGRRNLQRMITSEIQADEAEFSQELVEPAATNDLPEIDEEAIKEMIDTWDDSMVDPSLSQVMGQTSDEDKEVEDVLLEVSDMIETLASYQRNRNLTLPTSQDRFSADPPNGDMLRNGALSHQPTEEEMLTYQALKSQLSLIISTLPPFAVARINSDKLEELSVSTKIEIRTDDYKGVMEEDEQAARARQAAVQPSTSTQQRGSISSSSHRAPSMPGSVPYANQQYGGQYAATGRTPMAGTPQHYSPQTPIRAQQPNMYQRPTSAVPIPQPHQAQARLPPSAQQPHQQYRGSNGYGGLAPQLAKAQTPYGHSNMAQSPYNASAVAGQPRMQPHAGYDMAQSATPNPSSRHGYQPSPYGGPGYPQQQAQPPVPPQPPQPQAQNQAQMHPAQPHQTPGQTHPQPRPYSPYVNGRQVPQRTMSPHVTGQPTHGYSQSPTPPQQHQQLNRGPQYGTPTQVPMPPNGRNYSGPAPGLPPQASQRPSTVGVTGYRSFMGDAQQQQLMDQARQQVQAQQQAQARLDAQSRASTFGHEASQSNKVAGLAGIGLSGNMDIQRMAAMRTSSLGHNNGMPQSPKPPVPQPARSPMPGMNGSSAAPPPVASNMSPINNPSQPAGAPGPAS